MASLASHRVNRAENGWSLLDFLAARLGISRKQAKRLLDERVVFVNRRRVWMARHPLQAGDVVETPASARPAKPPAAVALLYEDEHALVVNKPAGVTSNGPGGLEERLQRQGTAGAVAVHRLDRDTTGCNLFAKSSGDRERLVRLFEEREVRKTYRAIAVGRISEHRTRVDEPVDNLEAVTHLRILRATDAATYVEARPETGRTHQIRMHLKAIGHPLAGDRVYLTRELADDALRQAPRQMLHASRITWTCPWSGRAVNVEAPLPPDFRDVLRALRLG